MRAILLQLALLGIAVPVAAQDVIGTWHGTWAKHGDALPVTVRFERSAAGLSGNFSSDALQVEAIPFASVAAEGDRIRFELRGDSSTTSFDGRLQGGRMAGTLREGGETGSFTLRRTAPSRSRFAEREVRFANGAVTLSGTLFVPRVRGPRPAILFLHGSGPEGRWANHWLARRFAEAGFVALTYDKRGVGRSQGDWQTAGFELLAADAESGIGFLRSRADVDPSRIGIYGHSQGGSVAPIVGAHDRRVAFIIASAAPGLVPAEVERYSVGNSIGISRLPETERMDAARFISAIVDVGYRGGARALLDALAREYQGRSWFFAPPPPDNFYWRFAGGMAGFDPRAFWARVRAPVLLVYGDRDERVPPDESAAAIRAALLGAGNRRVTLRIYPGADHNFVLTGGAAGDWPRHVTNYSLALVAWALRQPPASRRDARIAANTR